MGYQVLEGDSLEVMRGMDAVSVDALVTDPPAGISFMGKSWDSNRGSRNAWIAWLAEVMEEAYRVMKPGAHGLVWALPRTSHWTAMALEDAGFEVRDRIAHHFGSGFPKSANVGKAIDKIQDWSLVERISEEIKRAREEAGWSLQETGKRMMDVTDGQYGKWYHRGGFKFFETGRTLPSRPEWEHLRRLLPIADEFQALYEKAEREVLGRHQGVPGLTADNGWNTGPFSRGEAGDITAPATESAKQWDGFGTALKPATEDWWLIRKPLSASLVARNVLEWGTGALNIDGCRVNGTPAQGRAGKPGANFDDDDYEWKGEYNPPNPSGRWPANLLLSHSELCRATGEVRRVKAERIGSRGAGGQNGKYSPIGAGKGHDYADPDGTEPQELWECHPSCPIFLMDEMSGQTVSSLRGKDYKGQARNNVFGQYPEEGANPSNTHGDKGGASRYFMRFDAEPGFLYQAKASRRERNAGLEGMPESAPQDDGLKTSVDGREGRPQGDRTSQPTTNGHPTVKPIALMRYLCRLITPPGGTVLDPFCGSGSTGCAAALEHFNFIGIEKEAEYAEIAKRRIAHWSNDRAPAATAEAALF